MPTMPTVLTISGSAAVSRTFSPDFMNMTAQFNLSVASIMNSTAAAPTYNVEVSNDPSSAASITWFSSLLTGAASNSLLQVTTPCRSLRVNVTSNSSQGAVTSTVIQSG